MRDLIVSPPLPLFDSATSGPTSSSPPALPPLSSAWRTRLNALLKSRSTSARDRRRVLKQILLTGPATDWELQQALGMDGNTQRPRRCELAASGVLVDSRAKRRTRGGQGQPAIVWMLTNQLQPASILWLLKRLDEDAR